MIIFWIHWLNEMYCQNQFCLSLLWWFPEHENHTHGSHHVSIGQCWNVRLFQQPATGNCLVPCVQMAMLCTKSSEVSWGIAVAYRMDF